MQMSMSFIYYLLFSWVKVGCSIREFEQTRKWAISDGLWPPLMAFAKTLVSFGVKVEEIEWTERF